MNIDVLIENVVELLTNTVNMTSKFYDIFLNPEPMDVTLEQYIVLNANVPIWCFFSYNHIFKHKKELRFAIPF